MIRYEAETLVTGLAFPEAPRWHADQLWFTDQHARMIYSMDPIGELDLGIEVTDLPGGLGWLPDGRLLVVYMTEKRIMQLVGTSPIEYADLSRHASFHCNDMIVDVLGRAYVGNFGFDLHSGAPQRAAELILVERNGTVTTLTDNVIFPNGCVITPGGGRLICAETFANRLTEFQLDTQGRFVEQKIWANLGKATPDGISLDEEGAIWMASPLTNELLRVQRGGLVLACCKTTGTPYACALGGADGKTLYVCTSETSDPKVAAIRKSGRIERAVVDVGNAVVCLYGNGVTL